MIHQGIQPLESHARHTGNMCLPIGDGSDDFLSNISPQVAQ